MQFIFEHFRPKNDAMHGRSAALTRRGDLSRFSTGELATGLSSALKSKSNRNKNEKMAPKVSENGLINCVDETYGYVVLAGWRNVKSLVCRACVFVAQNGPLARIWAEHGRHFYLPSARKRVINGPPCSAQQSALVFQIILIHFLLR